MKDDRKICVGQFAGAHGVRGLVRLKSFTDEPDSIARYKPSPMKKARSSRNGQKSLPFFTIYRKFREEKKCCSGVSNPMPPAGSIPT